MIRIIGSLQDHEPQASVSAASDPSVTTGTTAQRESFMIAVHRGEYDILFMFFGKTLWCLTL